MRVLAAESAIRDVKLNLFAEEGEKIPVSKFEREKRMKRERETGQPSQASTSLSQAHESSPFTCVRSTENT